MDFGKLIKRDKDLDKKKRQEKVRKSRYNKRYSWIKEEGDTRVFEKRMEGEQVAEDS